MSKVIEYRQAVYDQVSTELPQNVSSLMRSDETSVQVHCVCCFDRSDNTMQ